MPFSPAVSASNDYYLEDFVNHRLHLASVFPAFQSRL